jgi:hypothetical protein
MHELAAQHPGMVNNPLRSRERKPLFPNLQKALRKIFSGEGKQNRKRKEQIPVYKAEVPDQELSSAERSIRRASTWDELYDAIKLIANVPTSSNVTFSAHSIQQRIFKAYYSEDPQGSSRLIPRSFGLRNKYVQLLKRTFDERPIHKKVGEVVSQGNSGLMRLKDPEKYHSKSVAEAMKRITKIMEARGFSIQTHKMEAAKIAAEVVDIMMPYDYPGLEAGKVNADQAGSVTEIIQKFEVGVCRHRAPLLVAVLKKMGFDAYQITHAYKKAYLAHTLAYIADPEVAAFVNPGRKEDKWAVIPYHQYGRQNRDGMYGEPHSFTFRTTLNKWKKFAYNL